jgi:hypothetical protein
MSRVLTLAIVLLGLLAAGPAYCVDAVTRGAAVDALLKRDAAVARHQTVVAQAKKVRADLLKSWTGWDVSLGTVESTVPATAAALKDHAKAPAATDDAPTAESLTSLSDELTKLKGKVDAAQ